MMTSLYLSGAILASLSSAAIHVSFRDPSSGRSDGSDEANKKARRDVKAEPKDRIAEHHSRKFAFFTLLGWVKFVNFKVTPFSAAAQAVYLFKLHIDKQSDVLPKSAPSEQLVRINMLLYTSIILGGLLRYWCYKTLDKYFTFRLDIKSDQKLIKNGPYKYLAHPSYFGIFLCNVGVIGSLAGPFNVLLSLLSKGASESLSGASPHSVVRSLLTLQALAGIWSAYALVLLRVPDEENMLRKHFGKEYDEYLAKRWRMLPFIW
ncbi:PROTEIN-S ISOPRENYLCYSTEINE O-METHYLTRANSFERASE [Ceraceosorus bombacis]|uniref:Protein-S-isoprenylcysteine O-methyltransferase n=1 Tax=Ceraceosorus bombacis TaxID=401625 RepID=A0A0P1BFP4_9BASI|nr:PROTEIN-S ISOPRENYLCYSTEINE O-METHYLTRANSFERASE [Ceraceosorus bombacis]